MPLVTLLGAGVGAYAVWQWSLDRSRSKAQEAQEAPFDVAELPVEVASGSAREFLAELGEQGDNLALRVVDAGDQSNAAVSAAAEEPEEFRLDVSKDGLSRTLGAVLETKRIFEAREIARIRRIPVWQRPAGHEEELRTLRKEKAEIKRLLKDLAR